MKHSDYVAVIFVTGLGGGLILKAASRLVGNARLETAANFLMAIPVILLIGMIPIVIAANHFINRKLRAKKKGQAQPSHDADTQERAPEQ